MANEMELSAEIAAQVGSNGPSLLNPTWNYLHENFTKIELQKQCRELGLTKIWVTKEKLIDMIMEKHQSSSIDVGNHEAEPNSPIQKILSDIIEIKDKLNVKDVEIRDLSEKLKVSNITIGRLNDRISMLEDQVRQGQLRRSAESTPSTESSPVVKTLILGDTNLSNITSSDLGEDCSVRTIKEANIDLIRCWVAEKLNWIPSRCILYCGIFDVLDNATPNKILDNLGTLVSELKEKNEDMEIYICQLVPTLNSDELQARINEYNDQLMNWSSTNGVSLIKTDLPFRLGTGEADDMCYDLNKDKPGLFFK